MVVARLVPRETAAVSAHVMLQRYILEIEENVCLYLSALRNRSGVLRTQILVSLMPKILIIFIKVDLF